MKIALVARAVVVPIGSLSAEQLWLECGHDLVVIDTSGNTVQAGDDPPKLFADGRKYQREDKHEVVDYDYPVCKYNMTQYVHISEGKIECGESGENINRCGTPTASNMPLYWYNPGRISLYDFGATIDRNAGEGRFDSIVLQCVRFTGGF